MKKLLPAILAVALLIAALSACSNSDDGKNNSPDTSIKMTDTYTFKDPADLEFANRYVAYGDETCVPVGNTPGMLAMYDVFYADTEDAPLCNYKYSVFDTAENAKAYADGRAEIGFEVTIVEEDPCVMYIYSDGSGIAGSIDMFYGSGAIEEATVKAYVAYYAGAIKATVQ